MLLAIVLTFQKIGILIRLKNKKIKYIINLNRIKQPVPKHGIVNAGLASLSSLLSVQRF